MKKPKRTKKTGKNPKKKAKKAKKVGRPKKVFTPEVIAEIDRMALDNCHLDTIAMALGIAKDTLVRRFSTYITQKRAKGRADLRRGQRELSKTHAAVAIFLGKNELGQSDKSEIEHSGTVNFATALHKANAK